MVKIYKRTCILTIKNDGQPSQTVDLCNFLQKQKLNYKIKKIIIILDIGSDAKFYCNSLTDGVTVSFFLLDRSYLDFFVLLTSTGKKICASVKINIIGEGVGANIRGVCMAQKNKDIVLATEQNHFAANSCSKVIINSLIADHSSFLYNAKIFVFENASCSKVLQKNKNIIVGNDSIVESKPSMEVNNDFVECRHGSATGILNNDQLFYLQTRGLSELQAKRILVNGVFDFLINSLDNHDVKKDCEKRIRNELGYVL